MKPPARPAFIRDIPGAARKRRGNPEADLQRSAVQLLLQILPPGFVVHHSANEVRMGGPEGHKAQSFAVGMGIHPGFTDLLILGLGRCLFLELKSATGQLTDDQKAFRDFVIAEGHGWALIRSIDDVLAALAASGFPTRIKQL